MMGMDKKGYLCMPYEKRLPERVAGVFVKGLWIHKEKEEMFNEEVC